MAGKEKKVLLQEIESGGGKNILYPYTKIENVIDLEDKLLRCKTITLAVANWVQNTTTKNYEYTVTDNTITVNHLVDGRLDLINQVKIKDGYIDSFNGGYKIITSEKPKEAITMNVSIQKVGG